MVEKLLVQTVQAGASLAACYLFASLYPDLRRARAARTTGRMPLLPLASMFANCALWCLYGLLARDFFPLCATNGVGLGFSAFYLAVFYRYTPRRAATQRALLATAAALALVALYAACSLEPRAVVQQRVGYVAIAVCAVMFGSPLVLVKQVVATRNADVLPFGMILAGVVNSVLWLTYGFILDDMIVLLPNLLNLVLGAIQLVLICAFPRPTGYAKVDKSKKTDSEPKQVDPVELDEPELPTTAASSEEEQV